MQNKKKTGKRGETQAQRTALLGQQHQMHSDLEELLRLEERIKFELAEVKREEGSLREKIEVEKTVLTKL